MVTSGAFIGGIIAAIFASSGMWGLILYLVQTKRQKSTAEQEMLRGLGHARLQRTCKEYLQRGHITTKEYADLHDHLYKPYKALGGNGSIDKLMQKVDELPVKEDSSSI